MSAEFAVEEVGEGREGVSESPWAAREGCGLAIIVGVREGLGDSRCGSL